jgi:hypothetical protein
MLLPARTPPLRDNVGALTTEVNVFTPATVWSPVNLTTAESSAGVYPRAAAIVLFFQRLVADS